jgi:hypothetical protein
MKAFSDEFHQLVVAIGLNQEEGMIDVFLRRLSPSFLASFNLCDDPLCFSLVISVKCSRQFPSKFWLPGLNQRLTR